MFEPKELNFKTKIFFLSSDSGDMISAETEPCSVHTAFRILVSHYGKNVYVGSLAPKGASTFLLLFSEQH